MRISYKQEHYFHWQRFQLEGLKPLLTHNGKFSQCEDMHISVDASKESMTCSSLGCLSCCNSIRYFTLWRECSLYVGGPTLRQQTRYLPPTHSSQHSATYPTHISLNLPCRGNYQIITLVTAPFHLSLFPKPKTSTHTRRSFKAHYLYEAPRLG